MKELVLTTKEIRILMTLLGGPVIPIIEQFKAAGIKVDVTEITNLFLTLGDAYDLVRDREEKAAR